MHYIKLFINALGNKVSSIACYYTLIQGNKQTSTACCVSWHLPVLVFIHLLKSHCIKHTFMLYLLSIMSHPNLHFCICTFSWTCFFGYIFHSTIPFTIYPLQLCFFQQIGISHSNSTRSSNQQQKVIVLF